MKTPEEIEKLAKDNIFTEEGQVGFVVGYSRCLKDFMDDKHKNHNQSGVISEWQLCPKCNGEGYCMNISGSTSSSINRTCPVCSGYKLLVKPINND